MLALCSGEFLKAVAMALHEGPSPTFSPRFIQSDGARFGRLRLCESTWVVAMLCAQVVATVSRARLTPSAPSPLLARAELIAEMKQESLLVVANAGAIPPMAPWRAITAAAPTITRARPVRLLIGTSSFGGLAAFRGKVHDFASPGHP